MTLFKAFGLILMAIGSIVSIASGTAPAMSSPQDKNLKWGPCPELFPKGCQVSVLQGDPAKGRSDVFLKFPPNYDVPAHYHTSAEHMTLVSGKLNLKYEGQKMMELKEGNYIFGPEKHAHQAKCVSQEDCVLMISFDRPIDAFPAKRNL